LPKDLKCCYLPNATLSTTVTIISQANSVEEKQNLEKNMSASCLGEAHINFLTNQFLYPKSFLRTAGFPLFAAFCF